MAHTKRLTNEIREAYDKAIEAMSELATYSPEERSEFNKAPIAGAPDKEKAEEFNRALEHLLRLLVATSPVTENLMKALWEARKADPSYHAP